MGEGLPIRHSGVSDIMNEISDVSAEAQGSGKIFKTPRLDAQEKQRRERQAEELMMHVSRHTRKRPLSCDEKKRREMRTERRSRARRREKEPLGRGFASHHALYILPKGCSKDAASLQIDLVRVRAARSCHDVRATPR